ncbi:MAG: hypothetical protein K5892_02975 [Acholeplasmatales bacterium]|nr:hypothetical protein [Acholeplasmatales bacterium]
MLRRHNKLYLILTLLIMAFTFTFITFKSIIKVNAGGTANPVSGLYMKVKDDNPIKVGDRVLIASTSRVVMSGAGGNPGYIYGDTSGFAMSDNNREGHLQDSDDRIYAENSNILEFEVCQGAVEGSFAFKTVLASLGSYETNVTAYLAYVPDNNTCHKYDGISYWAVRTGFDDGGDKDNEAWNVSFDTVNGVSEMHNCAIDASLRYRAGSSARVWFGLNGPDMQNQDLVIGINIYKKVSGSEIVADSVNPPTKFNYKPSEEIDFSGLNFTFRYGDGTNPSREEYIYYDDEKDLFKTPSNVYNSGQNKYEVEYLDHKFYVTLNVSDLAYRKIDYALDDYGGSYVLISYVISDDGTDYFIPNGVAIGDESAKNPTKRVTENYIANENGFSTFYGSVGEITWNEAASFIISFDGNNYYIKNYDGKYLRKGNNGEVYLSDTKGDPIYFSLSDGNTYIKLVGTNETLSLYDSTVKYVANPDSNKLMVYSAALKQEVITEINTFVNHIFDTAFDYEEGRCFSSNSHGYIKEAFEALSPIAKAYVTNVKYTHKKEVTNSLEDMMNVYDNTIARRGDDFADFMNRKTTYSYTNIVKGLIDEIGVVTLDKESLINDAKDAYNGLTAKQKEFIPSESVQALEDAIEKLKVLNVSITPLQQEAIVGEYTYVRFIFILNGYNELTSADFENQLTIILDEGLSSEKTIERTPNAYNKLTASGDTYVATVGEDEYTFDNAINKDDIYIIYVIKFTTEKYAGHNVKASLIYNETEYKTSGYDFE